VIDDGEVGKTDVWEQADENRGLAMAGIRDWPPTCVFHHGPGF
jgi:hypothetical protein